MSKHFMLVNKESCAIISEYFADEQMKDPMFLDENVWLHMEIPMEAVVSYLRVARIGANKFSIVEDLSKKQSYMNLKLQELKDSVRNQRNRLLADSDWTMTADAPLTEEKKWAWKKYRQQLRDMPVSITQLQQKIVWPSPPS